MKRRTIRKRHRIRWKRLGFVTAMFILLPALIIARCYVTSEHTGVFWISAILTFWAEYRLGFLK